MKELSFYLARIRANVKINWIVALSFLIFTIPHDIHAQGAKTPITVKGTVSDVEGEPLAGVSVAVKGTTQGTMSDHNGNYTLQAPGNSSILRFSFMGFAEQTITVGSKREINIVMTENSKDLDEVIVVGYGTAKKRDITGSIASISAKTIEETSPVSIFDAIQGQLAGVEVTTGSGAPGEVAEVRIRGMSTFGEGSKPLYVVDGVPMDDISTLNPGDIESMEVLKDAASAAIYGSRSANGVFLITTKQGERTNPSLNIQYLKSYSKLIRKMPKANGDERRHYDSERRRLTALYNPGSVSAGLSPTDTLAFFNNQDMDLQDVLFHTAERDQIDLSASGGSDAFKYYMNFGYLTDKGIIVNTKFDRITARVNSEYIPTKVATIGSKMNLSYSTKSGMDEDGVLNQLLERVPYWAIYTPDGSFVPNVYNRRNPLAVAEGDVDQSQTYAASLYQYLKLKFNPKLQVDFTLQGNYSNWRQQKFRHRDQLGTTEEQVGRDNSAVRYDWANENYVTYNDKFGKDHEFNAMAGTSLQEKIVENIRIAGSDYASDEIYTLNTASRFLTGGTFTNKSINSMASFFGRAGYNYKGRYIFNTNLRYDGSSRFGADTKWGLFPSASGGWRFSDESFTRWMKPLVHDAKVRVSWGVTGNSQIGDYDAWQLYSPAALYDGVMGIAASRLALRDLSWEKTTQTNIGLDLSLLKGKLSIIADAYWKNTDDLLANVELPKETGFSTMRTNVGAMTNKGFEFSVKYDIIRNKNVTWSGSFNIATNTTKITRLADGIPFYKGKDDALYIQENAKLGDFYGYKYLGIFAYDESNAFTQNGERLTPVFANGVFQNKYLHNGQDYNETVHQKKASNGILLRGGDIDFLDVDNDFVVNTNDKTKIGNAQADFFGGIGTNLRYRRVTLTMNVVFSFGGDVYNAAEAKRNLFAWDGATPSPDAIHNMWLKPGDDAKYPLPVSVGRSNNALVASSFYIEDGSYVKLSNVKVSYNFANKLLKKVFMKNANAYVYGKNLLTFTDYKGYDPEFSNTDALTMGIDQNRYPRKREFGCGLSVTF